MSKFKGKTFILLATVCVILGVAATIYARSLTKIVSKKESRLHIQTTQFRECALRAVNRTEGILAAREQTSVDEVTFMVNIQSLPNVGGLIDRITPDEVRITLVSQERFSTSRDNASQALLSRLTDSLRHECAS